MRSLKKISDNVFARHTHFATATRRAVYAWGMTTIANERMLMIPFSDAEVAMKEQGYAIELGSGIAASQEYLEYYLSGGG